jgi:hypothetical protein
MSTTQLQPPPPPPPPIRPQYPSQPQHQGMGPMGWLLLGALVLRPTLRKALLVLVGALGALSLLLVLLSAADPDMGGAAVVAGLVAFLMFSWWAISNILAKVLDVVVRDVQQGYFNDDEEPLEEEELTEPDEEEVLERDPLGRPQVTRHR